ncbi:hypothetical protein RvY_07682-5 [Ramazzottius varieornatus]|uniref:Uncharacterized protein n=1 Tax=Ramazzottius varieornatus TaxID=947166 RepID=A0A1D1V5Q9_RAMVA|nr:hypothetical protein RvY_07682-5 [Ramazzottius varieornatus]
MKNSSDGFLNDQKPANFVTCEHWLCCEEYHIVISCLLIIGCQIVGMLVSAVLKYEKIKHCSGGTTFFLLALVNLLTSQVKHSSLFHLPMKMKCPISQCGIPRRLFIHGNLWLAV